jgi:AbrB family looped-hinge helix DNA binding protein
MITTMDGAGRVVLPKAARERAELSPGVAIEVRVVDGRIELEPARARVTIEKHGGLWVAAPADDVPVLTQDQVDNTMDAVRLRSTHAARPDD